MSIAAKNIIRLLIASAAIIAAAVLLTFTVDPLQLFRPARLFAAMYSPDTRMQNAGLIRGQQFDTVFMGTSLAVHFRQSDIDKALGVRSLKLAMTGSNSREQSFVLDVVMERRPKRVIWQMDDWIFREAGEIDANIYLPANLYRRNAAGLSEYLLSGAMARESLWPCDRFRRWHRWWQSSPTGSCSSSRSLMSTTSTRYAAMPTSARPTTRRGRWRRSGA
jgi:hypothetical protein